MDEPRVIRNEPALRYELHVDGELAGWIPFGRRGRRLVLHDTRVEPAFEGRGLGSTFVEAALDDVRARGETIVPLCPFVRRFLERRPEYADLVAA